jgi:hypothetical protein
MQRDKFGFKHNFAVIDDGNLSDQLYIQFTPDMEDILVVIDQPECDVPSFIFDMNEICTMAYIQCWFRNHQLYEHEKTIEIYYPKLNESIQVKINRENLDKMFGRDFLKNDQVDNNYISNLKYIQKD